MSKSAVVHGPKHRVIVPAEIALGLAGLGTLGVGLAACAGGRAEGLTLTMAAFVLLFATAFVSAADD